MDQEYKQKLDNKQKEMEKHYQDLLQLTMKEHDQKIKAELG